MRRDQIVAFYGRIPCRNFCLNELHMIDRQRRPEQAFAGNLEHPGARIHIGHLDRWVALQQRYQELPVAFADQKGALDKRDLVPKRVAAPLQLPPREQRFQQIVVPGEMIELCRWSRLQGVRHSVEEDFAIPPNTCDHGAQRIRNDIKQVADSPGKNRWSQQFRDDRPDQEMSENLRYRWWAIVVAQLEPPLKPKNERQRGGNEKQIIEMMVKKRPRANGFNQPAIGAIEETSRQTQRVERVTECLHRRAVIASPVPIARSIFRLNTIMEGK